VPSKTEMKIVFVINKRQGRQQAYCICD